MPHDQHGDLGSQIFKAVSGNRDMGKDLIGEFVHQLAPDLLFLLLGIRDSQFIQDILNMFLRIDAVGSVRHRHDIAHRPVILIPDLSDKLLQNILVCDNTQGTAVIVRDDSNIDLLPRHHLEQIIDLGRLVDETGFIQERPDIQGLASSNIMTDVAADM